MGGGAIGQPGSDSPVQGASEGCQHVLPFFIARRVPNNLSSFQSILEKSWPPTTEMDDYCMRSFQALPYPSLPYPLALFGLNGWPEYSLLDYQSESNLGFFRLYVPALPHKPG